MSLAPVPPVVIQKKRGKGCLGCGCAVLAVLAVLFVVFVVFVYRKAEAMGVVYTSATPADIPTTDGGDAVYQAAQGKLATFQLALQQHQPAVLHLGADEINTLIARDPACASVHGRLHVSIEGDSAEIESSLPLGAVEKAFLTNRYFNSDATLGVGFNPAAHALVLDLRRLQLNGQPVPANASASLNQTLNTLVNQQLQLNAQAKDFLAHAEKIDIENGELVIESR